MASDEVVRRPLRSRGRSRRTLDQRLLLRFPGLTAALWRLISKRPPSSRLRRSFVSRGAVLSLEAYNRRDLEAVLIGAAPDFEYRPDRAWVKAGLVEACYTGLEGYRSYVATVDEVWGGENYLKPVELIDLGGQFVMLADGEMRAQASGVPLSEAYAAVVTLRDGQPARLQEYYDHAEALAAVGVSAAQP